jgi:hypothetical protein
MQGNLPPDGSDSLKSSPLIPSLSTFIIHYSKLSYRKALLISSESIQALMPTFITEEKVAHGKTFVDGANAIASILHILAMNQLILAKVPPDELSRNTLKLTASNSFFNQSLSAYRQSKSRGNRELCLQHISAMQLALNKGSEFCLILEDDAIPRYRKEDLIFRLRILIESLPRSKPCFCDISSSLGLTLPAKGVYKVLSYYEVIPGQTRCSAAYLLNSSAIEQLLASIERMMYDLPVDWLLTAHLSRLFIATFWLKDPLFDQGSENIMRSNAKERKWN